MRMRRLLAAAVVAPVVLTPALASTPAALPATPDLLGAGVRMLLALLLVVALILLAGWVGRRMQRGVARGPAPSLRALASVHVGQRERVVLLQAGPTQLLLGVAPGQVRALHVFDTPVVVPEQAATTAPDFAQALRQVLQRRGAP